MISSEFLIAQEDRKNTYLIRMFLSHLIIESFLKGEVGGLYVEDKLSKTEVINYLSESLGNDFCFVLEELENFMDDDLIDEEVQNLTQTN